MLLWVQSVHQQRPRLDLASCCYSEACRMPNIELYFPAQGARLRRSCLLWSREGQSSCHLLAQTSHSSLLFTLVAPGPFGGVAALF